jgi:GNAT superfamily N-acetyltransferase
LSYVVTVQVEGDWQVFYDVVKYMSINCKGLEYLGVDKALHALGLVVKREYRGAKLGARLLAARYKNCR